MIDREVFAQAMGYLGERFNRALNPALIRAYYEILSPELDTDEIQVAVQLAIRHLQFWPSPQQLIDYARPPVDMTLEAARMFETVRKLGRIHPVSGVNWHREDVTALGAPALAGFDAIGANEGLKHLDARYLSVTRRDFIEAYIAAVREQKSIAQVEEARKRLVPRERPRIPGPVYSTPPVATPIGSVVADVVRGASA